jgi:hypothetical protein
MHEHLRKKLLKSLLYKDHVFCLQMNKDGVIPKDNWTHRWMVPFINAMSSVDRNIIPFLKANPVPIEIPLRIFNWESFISHAKTFFKTNFMQFIMLLCGGIGLFHYQKIIKLECKCLSNCGQLTFAK